ncbi:DUF4956 domain-containing protein [Ornithinimicrobium sp. F0845]|uniref:DUF4956 domain-containing protein n=1 Tax=Ornithinimicrobium sp. F0845 TaxID=2926412 RepID=UPI001FF3E5DF|nr:DUF4956 domain-containing protein [Ornithinimicrobium sp. F0845]MCK0113300.1 DUF4956 domain-containing protein [Ornithinimicrobium sp. F0845]
MNTLVMPAADLVAIIVLTAVVYLPRHRRTELVPAFVGVNVGVLAVSMALGSAAASIGLGLGLFGVLSIIRLRSAELSQREIAYYFASLALGLLGGIGVADPALGAGLMALIVLSLVVADHPRLVGRGVRRELVILDRAVPDETRLRAQLEALLGATVVAVDVIRLDLVNDSTHVEVTFRRGELRGPVAAHPVGPRAEVPVR